MESIWRLGSPGVSACAPLKAKTEADVVVIGAGITGLTTALPLVEAGQRVLVLEAKTVGSGVTGGSTGNLYSTLASGQAALRSKWGDAVSADVIWARNEAIDDIEALIRRFSIDCGFRRQSAYRLFIGDRQHSDSSLNDERDALGRAGLDIESAEGPGLPFDSWGIRIPDQAQFNPLHYVQGLASALIGEGGVIHEHSPVRRVDAKEGVVQTDTARIAARHIVYATHTPKGISLLQAGMVVSREYAVAARLRSGEYPEGIFWLLDPFHSLRSYRHGDASYLVVVGEKLAIHRTEAGELKVLSAVCPHLKCIVHWNAAESTWDCPCHGSRFDTDGEVIEGPAYHPLGRPEGPV